MRMNEHNFYPSNPANVDPLLIRPGKTFRREVFKVVLAILLFCLVYLLLLAAALGIAGGFVAAGGFLLTLGANYLVILVGLSLIGVGIFIIIYLFKFVFARFEDSKAGRVEVLPEDHPHLFDFIRQLTSDTKTPMPKRVYISPGVGACVFYDSSFLSMILPVKKNLEIGLGLVNSLNISEFKQVLAHEFGHFSQRSMRFGGYIYTLNHIIYNMLYQNRSYSKMLAGLQRIHSVFLLTGHLTVAIIKVIQTVLRRMYEVINLSHRRLSKEMEFHADAVAVSVTGSDIAVSAIRRVEFGEMCMQFCTNKFFELAGQNKILENIYDLQRSIIAFTCEQYKVETVNGLPVLKNRPLPGVSKSRIQYEDLWSSHPSEEERETRYREANITNTADNRLAWELFSNRPALEEEMTKHLAGITFPAADFQATISKDELLKELKTVKAKFEMPAVFNGYYNRGVFPSVEDITVPVQATSLEEFYSTGLVEKVNEHLQNKQDKDVLEAIAAKQIAVEQFKLDGKRFQLSEVETVLAQLCADVEKGAQWLKQRDQEAYQLNLNLAGCEEERNKLKSLYSQILRAQEYLNQLEIIAIVLKMKIEEIYNRDDWDLNGLLAVIEVIKEKDNELKVVMRSILDDPALVSEAEPDFKTQMEAYLGTNYPYFVGNTCSSDELMSTYHTGIRSIENVDIIFKLLRKKYLDTVVSHSVIVSRQEA